MDRRRITLAKVVLLASSLASTAILALVAYQENYGGQWRETQDAYRALLVRHASNRQERRAAEGFSIELRQLYVQELDAVDRCITCHLGVENPAMADAEQPLRLHSGSLLAHHPPEYFGCTICHAGQGRATSRDAAHGWRSNGEPVHGIDKPLLRAEAVYTSCGRCHCEFDLYGGEMDLYAASFTAGPVLRTKPEIDEATLGLDLPVADVVLEGKRLVVEKGCLGCHRYRGGGGDLGPDLTFVGDKSVHDFDFSHVEGEHTVEQWHYEHFLRPDQVSSGTLMPRMEFTPGQARSLALYMMSLHRKNAPATHIPPPQHKATPTVPVSGETLYKMFCSACHGETGRGDGPAARTIWGQPRDFWHERFRYVSTLNGVPTKKDLLRTIGTGRQFGEMPSDPQLTEVEVIRLAEYVLELNRKGLVERLTEAFEEDEITPEEIEEIADDRLTPERIIIVPWPGPTFRPDNEVGRTLFTTHCSSCHGSDGRGDGPQELLDELGRAIRARDLSRGKFRGGAEPEEIFKRIRCGIPGTPMPVQDNLGDEEVWQIVHYVLGLAGLGD